MNGRMNPPNAASTWRYRPVRRARSANASTGSSTPKLPPGAEHTRPTVRGVMARSTSSIRGRYVSSSTSISTSRMPISSAPSRKLKCIVTGAMISGSAWCPRFRASRIAARFDSVPPVVMNPPAPPSPPSSDAIIATASRSIDQVPSSVSRAHSTKNRPRASSSTCWLIADGIPE